MNILIPGGSGLIGTALARALAEEGHKVWVLTRNVQNTRLAPGIQAVQWDGKTGQGWADLVNGADAIINLAGANIGAGRWTPARKQVLRDSRVQAGQAVVAAIQAAQQPPAVLIQMSGINHYGTGTVPVTEDSPPGSDFLANLSKDWEASTEAVERLGVRRVVMRTGVVLARQGGVLAPFLLQHRLFAGGPLGSGKQWISWIHLQDLIAAFRFFLNTPEARGVFNVTAPEPVTNAAFGRTMGRVMRRPYWLPAPAFAMRLVLGEMSTLVLDGLPALPARLQAIGFAFQYGALQSALEDLLQ